MTRPNSRLLALPTIALLGGAVLWMAGAGSAPSQPPAPPPGGAPKGPGGSQPGDRPGPGGERGPGGGRQGGGMNIESAMKAMNRGQKALQENLANPAKRDDNLRAVGEMQQACVAAKNQTPNMLHRGVGDEAEKAKVTLEYRKDLLALARALLDLEQAILDNRPDAAAKALDEVIRQRAEAHRERGIKG